MREVHRPSCPRKFFNQLTLGYSGLSKACANNTCRLATPTDPYQLWFVAMMLAEQAFCRPLAIWKRSMRPCRCCSLISRFGAQMTWTVALVCAHGPACSLRMFCIAFTHTPPLSRSAHIWRETPRAVRAREGGHITYTAPDASYVEGEHVRTVSLRTDHLVLSLYSHFSIELTQRSRTRWPNCCHDAGAVAKHIGLVGMIDSPCVDLRQ